MWLKIGMVFLVASLKNLLYCKDELMNGADFLHADDDAIIIH